MKSRALVILAFAFAMRSAAALVAPRKPSLSGRSSLAERSPRLSTKLNDVSLSESISVAMFDFQTTIDGLVRSNMGTVSPVSVGVTWIAGILTALSPCCLSLLPVTVAFLSESALGETDNRALRLNTLLYAIGNVTWVFQKLCYSDFAALVRSANVK
uniref:Cytochrome C biogenesis protein transmembrane domain-containing protein n=1 Tax=Pinguiococcus pyrenoidosus TaxID=172671 RepID=A0A7R9YEU3_9STRA|mmetsp:Transcript_6700/g.25894  ORF Transcript_6700/g.25894 Transcript_6700/m.25894 type:complete len:157 (+) Transcript_6700:66-536(+)